MHRSERRRCCCHEPTRPVRLYCSVVLLEWWMRMAIGSVRACRGGLVHRGYLVDAAHWTCALAESGRAHVAQQRRRRRRRRRRRPAGRQQQQQARQQPPAAASRALTWRRRLLEGAGLRLEGLHARTNLWVVALLGRGRRVVGRRVGLGVARSTLDVERLELQRAAGRLVDLRHDGTGLGGASIELCEPQVSVRGKPLRRHK